MKAPDWNDATRAQVTAASPDTSTWLSANAGSGKTRVLTDRVARLLLNRVEPQHILCLTYTKAAASEMQNRLFRRLGDWAMMDDDDLRPTLLEMGVLQDLDAEDLRRARTLFAQAIETPGGLKIQTIHSFCAALLRRFPLEAGVSPQFKEIEDRAAELLRAEIVDAMADGPDAPLVAGIAKFYTGESFGKLTQSIASQREAFDAAGQGVDLNALFDLPPHFDAADLPAWVIDKSVASWLPTAIGVLRGQSATMVKLADTLDTIDVQAPDADMLQLLKELFLYRDKSVLKPEAKTKSVPTKKAQEALGPTLIAFHDLMERTAQAHDMELRARNVARTGALHAFARSFIDRYEAKKVERGLLDFDDLILRARTLLTDPKVAAWVLYRIDGGIDHILVDEAQDTSPRQWDVIERLTDEFTSGAGARAKEDRTLFVVGDKKQSIYSFQGADPREFDAKRESFANRFGAVDLPFSAETLDYSFRSSDAILTAVDQTLNPRIDERMHHLAFKDRLPGRVDLWPLVEPQGDEEEGAWYEPLDRKSPQHHSVVLGQQVADQIKYLVEGDHYIPADGPDKTTVRRRITPGDFLILVQGRSDLFAEIIRACKAADLPIAGADRLKVAAELAVRDIGALLAFLATPEDSLSLATTLRSPLFGWSEQQLFTLAHGRSEKHLWQALRTQTDIHPETVSVLQDLRGQIDFLRPYDLIERLLTRHGGRARLLARLGTEAEDGIDALLAQALAYEQSDIPSLTRFLEWMETDDLEIKRQIDSASDQIRVMTVHGAKGLEAPIVILPDTALRADTVKDEIITMEGVPIWKPGAAEITQRVSTRLTEIKEAQRQERLRLLYVAMTRAEKWLIVAAAGRLNKEPDSWYQMIEQALGHLNAVPFSEGPSHGLRYQTHDWDGLPVKAVQRQTRKTPELDPLFIRKIGQLPDRQETITPSSFEGAKALAGDTGQDEEAAKAYGTLVHLLLEHLAPLPAGDRYDVAVRLTATRPAEVASRAIAEAMDVLAAPALAPIFAPDALAEVAVTADLGGTPMYGIIDRLIIGERDVLAVDFKTNRTVPEHAADTPEGLLRQMGAYGHALQQVYPDKNIRCAILWTQAQTLMELGPDAIKGALFRSGHLDAGQPRS
ncbi:double-strand break repair helicase AddA [Sulfitobacter sp. S190]|uniref:double-strand break repair helicase AddA n=1 Tax=Sulfitobacter sp. S190 TaxID=2867022 RepID=UPI0021A2CB22|nr:double-strand break repair helicase AddA [Sulfitobacter sp. S190]UWR22455.1 double-strand break repair helicase AddA [Sulfitobacter sp. S190]